VSQFDLTAVINPDDAKAAMMAAVFSFGLVAFGFLGMGPVTIAVDSYGPVTDNAQSVYELSMIEQMPGIQAEVKRDFGFDLDFRSGEVPARRERRRRQHLQGNRQAGVDRHRGGRRDDHGFFHRHAAHWWPDRKPGQAVFAAPAVPARPDRRWGNDLLVLRRQHAGRFDGCLPCGRVHQHPHPPR
jgi:hypothetical protein